MTTMPMSGKTCVVTGATSGIGLEIARGLAGLGAEVALLGRNPAKGEAALRSVRESTGNAALRLHLADLSAMSEVGRVASELLEAYPRIHVLVNNAGLIHLRRTTTVDGLEATLALNHLAPFLLTNRLRDRMIESAPARIVNVASLAHRFAAADLDDLQSERSYRSMQVYGRTKLYNILFTRELARQLAGTGVTVNSYHPGAVASAFGQNNGAWARATLFLLRPFFRTPARGAETGVYLASSPEVEGISGKYFVDCREAKPDRSAEDDEVARRLWKISSGLVGLPV